MQSVSLVPFVVGLAGALVLYAVALGVVLVVTAGPRVQVATTPAEIGSLSPAEVDFVTAHATSENEAASATLLDLAARRLVDIEEIGPALSLVRLRPVRSDVALRPYEDLVMQRIRKLAVDGAVATGALAEAHSGLDRWWHEFTTAVKDDCKAHGLVRSRMGAGHRALLGVVAPVPAVATMLLGWALAARGALDSSDGEGSAFWLVICAGLLVYFGLVEIARRRGSDVLTTAGAQVAGQWFALRGHLAANPSFASLPAAAVTIWGRPLAYAAALGLTPRAVESLPVAQRASATHAWSDYTGMWRRVEVRYPSQGGVRKYGTPLRVVMRGLAATFYVAMGVGLGLVLLEVVGTSRDWDWSQFSLTTIVTVALVAAAVVAVVKIGGALTDLVAPIQVQGQIVRMAKFMVHEAPHYLIAVDDGVSPTARAYLCHRSVWDACERGDVVQVVVYRRCRWVKQLTTITQSRFREVSDDTLAAEPPQAAHQAAPQTAQRRPVPRSRV